MSWHTFLNWPQPPRSSKQGSNYTLTLGYRGEREGGREEGRKEGGLWQWLQQEIQKEPLPPPELLWKVWSRPGVLVSYGGLISYAGAYGGSQSPEPSCISNPAPKLSLHQDPSPTLLPQEYFDILDRMNPNLKMQGASLICIMASFLRFRHCQASQVKCKLKLNISVRPLTGIKKKVQ